MALGYKARRRWSLVVLLVGLPIYIVVAVNLTDWLRATFDGLHVLVELAIFVVLGFLWMIPLRGVFLGVGKGDPDTDQPDERD